MLSIVTVMLDGLLLNYVWSVDVYPLLITLEGLTLMLLVAAWWRRSRLMEDEKLEFNRGNGASHRVLWLDWVLGAVLALAVVGAGTVAVYAGVKNLQPYSELYLLGRDGKAADYPQTLAAGQTGQITLALGNHEHRGVSYTIRIVQQDGSALVDGQEQDEVSLTLASGQERSYTITFSFDAPGGAQKLEFDLYKADDPGIYLQTYLKVDVTG